MMVNKVLEGKAIRLLQELEFRKGKHTTEHTVLTFHVKDGLWMQRLSWLLAEIAKAKEE